MIALQIQDIKDFMNRLLLKETFDPFLVIEATITTYNTFHIDGRLKPDYYSPEERENQNITSPAGRISVLSAWNLLKGSEPP